MDGYSCGLCQLFVHLCGGGRSFYSPAAINVGQNNLLIVVGFVLSVMAFCMQRQALLAAILAEVRLGWSSLQNYDTLLRNSAFAVDARLTTRVFLLAFMPIPLGLSASHKKSTSDTSTAPGLSLPGYLGLTTAPDYQLHWQWELFNHPKLLAFLAGHSGEVHIYVQSHFWFQHVFSLKYHDSDLGWLDAGARRVTTGQA